MISIQGKDAGSVDFVQNSFNFLKTIFVLISIILGTLICTIEVCALIPVGMTLTVFQDHRWKESWNFHYHSFTRF